MRGLKHLKAPCLTSDFYDLGFEFTDNTIFVALSFDRYPNWELKKYNQVHLKYPGVTPSLSSKHDVCLSGVGRDS